MRFIPPFRDVKMIVRAAAWCAAAFLITVPAFAGIQTGTIAEANGPVTAIAAHAAMGVAATAIDVPLDKIEASSQGTNESRLEPQPNVEASVQANVQSVVPPTARESTQPDVQKALEPTTPDLPNAQLPRAVLSPKVQPRSELPRIDASFRFNVLPVNGGDVLAKWDRIKADIRAESEIFARCRADAAPCPATAKRFLGIVDQGRALTGRARIGVINRAINMAIEPVSDMAQWGVPDHWSAPLETFATRKGDCEDYAIAKYVALTEAGIAAEDVKLIIVRNTGANEDHAVTAVRLDDAWIILDNRWLTLVEDKAMPQAIPLFALGSNGVQQFLPDVLVGTRRAPAPASITK